MNRDYPVLVVDDNRELTAVLSQELRDEGFVVHTAATGEEGLALVRSRPISFAFLDIRLPGISGFEVLQTIKTEFPNVKIVMITSHSDVYHAMESKRLGADDFIGKPYDLGEVLTAIERLRTG